MISNKVIFFDRKLSKKNNLGNINKKTYVLQVTKNSAGEYVVRKKYMDSACKKTNIISL